MAKKVKINFDTRFLTESEEQQLKRRLQEDFAKHIPKMLEDLATRNPRYQQSVSKPAEIFAKKRNFPGLYRTAPQGYNFGINGDDILRNGYTFIKDKERGDLVIIDDNYNVVLRVPETRENLNFINQNGLWNRPTNLTDARKFQSIANNSKMNELERYIKEGGDLAGTLALIGAGTIAPGAAALVFTNPWTTIPFLAGDAARTYSNPNKENVRNLALNTGLTFLPFEKIITNVTNPLKSFDNAILTLADKKFLDKNDLEQFYRVITNPKGRQTLQENKNLETAILEAIRNSPDDEIKQAEQVYNYLKNKKQFIDANYKQRISEAQARLNSGKATDEDIALLEQFEENSNPLLSGKEDLILRSMGFTSQPFYVNDELIPAAARIKQKNGKLFVELNDGSEVQVMYNPDGKLIITKEQSGYFNPQIKGYDIKSTPEGYVITDNTTLPWYKKLIFSEKNNTLLDRFLKKFKKPKEESSSNLYKLIGEYKGKVDDVPNYKINFENPLPKKQYEFDYGKFAAFGLAPGVILGKHSYPVYNTVFKNVKEHYVDNDDEKLPNNAFEYQGGTFYKIQQGNRLYAVPAGVDSIAYPMYVQKNKNGEEVITIDAGKQPLRAQKIGKGGFYQIYPNESGFNNRFQPATQQPQSSQQPQTEQSLPKLDYSSPQPQRQSNTPQQQSNPVESPDSTNYSNYWSYNIPKIFKNINYV